MALGYSSIFAVREDAIAPHFRFVSCKTDGWLPRFPSPGLMAHSHVGAHDAGDWWRDAERYRDIDRCLGSYRYQKPDLDLAGDLQRDQCWDWLRVECRSDRYQERCQEFDQYRLYRDLELRKLERHRKYDQCQERDQCRDWERFRDGYQDQDRDQDRCCPALLGDGGHIRDGFSLNGSARTRGAAGCRVSGSVSAIKSYTVEKVFGMEGSFSSTAVCTGELTCTRLDGPCSARVDSVGAITCPACSGNGQLQPQCGTLWWLSNKKQSAAVWAAAVASSSGPEVGTGAVLEVVPGRSGAASL
ncbi:unnamed protein product [Caretta caretta]